MDVVTQILMVLIGGLLSGGILIAWIEFQRHRREKLEWELKDKKIVLRVISVTSKEDRWKTDTEKMEKERLRLFETGLDGKIKILEFFGKDCLY